MGFIVPIAKTVGEVVDRAIDEYCLRDMEEASTTVSDYKLAIKHSPR